MDSRRMIIIIIDITFPFLRFLIENINIGKTKYGYKFERNDFKIFNNSICD